jgi:teichuronic acid biosynthesis glycosyltransferase TuaC
LPTQHEGSSNVIVEAMASGLPIVSSDLPEIRVQCKQEYATLVDPMSVDDIANALNTILSNDNLREKMSQSALKASKRFDINQRAQRILQFINQNYE